MTAYDQAPELDAAGNAARYPAAVARAFDALDSGQSAGPDNVLRYDDGLVLILTRERHGPHELLHASAMIRQGSLAHEVVKGHVAPLAAGVQLARQRLGELTGRADWRLAFLALPYAVPHFYAGPLS